MRQGKIGEGEDWRGKGMSAVGSGPSEWISEGKKSPEGGKSKEEGLEEEF